MEKPYLWLGKKIEKRRLEKGYETQQDLATAMGSDRTRISRWESGEALPQDKNRRLLKTWLEVDDSFFEPDPQKIEDITLVELASVLMAYGTAPHEKRLEIRQILEIDGSKTLDLLAQVEHSLRSRVSAKPTSNK